METNKNINYHQLTFAREFRGLTKTELANRISGLSSSNLSKYERGLGYLSDGVLRKIMEELNFPFDFLYQRISNYSNTFHYRKKCGVSKAQTTSIERFTMLVAYVYDILLSDLDTPNFDVPSIDVESGATPTEIAQHIRRAFKLGYTPITKICNVLERHGVFIYLWNCPFKDFDGLTVYSDKGNCIVVINRNRTADRIRFTLAHELGHIVMHSDDNFIVNSRNLEAEANDFASEFLMPKQVISHSLSNLKINDLYILKRQWGTSMAAIIQQAKKTGCIDTTRYQSLMKQLCARGWRLNEPVQVDIDDPVVFAQAQNLWQKEFGYTIAEQAKTMCLPETDLGRILNHRIAYLKVATAI